MHTKWVQLLETPSYGSHGPGQFSVLGVAGMKEIAALSGIRTNECGGCFLEDYALISINLTGLHMEKCLNILESWAKDPRKKFSFCEFSGSGDDGSVSDIVNAFLLRTVREADDEDSVKNERLFLNAILGYLCLCAPKNEQNLFSFKEFLNAFQPDSGNRKFKNAVDLMIDEQEKVNPYCDPVIQYKKFRKLSRSVQVETALSLADRMENLGYRTKVHENFTGFLSADDPDR